MKLWQRAKSAYRSFVNPSPEVLRAFAGGSPVAAGVDVTPNTAMSASAVFACVRNVAEDLAKLPLIVYESIDPIGKQRRTDHALYPLVHDSSNPEMSAFDFRQAMTASAMLCGNGYAEIERNNAGRPLALWPIEWWRVKPKRDGQGVLYYEIDGGKTAIAAEDMFHLKGFGTSGLIGFFVVHAAREAIGLTIAAERFGASFFGNGSRLGGILERPADKKPLSDIGRANLRESFERIHQGVDSAHKIAILEEGVTWKQTSADPEEGQLLETRQFQLGDVARFFRMPPHKIGDLLRATFSNIESQAIEYVGDTLQPWFVRWEQEAKRKLISVKEPKIFVEHLADALMRGDALSRSQACEVQFRNGVLLPNEWRAIENRNALEDGGDESFVAVNMTTYKKLLTAPPPPPKNPADPLPAPDDAQARAQQIMQAHRSLLIDAVQRVMRVEIDKIKRAAAKPGFSSWAQQFYTDHANYVRSALAPAIATLQNSLAAIGAEMPDIDATRAAETYAKQALAALQVLAETRDAGETVKVADQIVQQWEQDRAQRFVSTLLDGKIVITK